MIHVLPEGPRLETGLEFLGTCVRLKPEGIVQIIYNKVRQSSMS